MSALAPIGFGLAAASGAVVGSLFVLRLGRHRATTVADPLLAYAIGALLAVGTLDLLPEALETAGAVATGRGILGGILIFVALERLLRFRHPHAPLADGVPHGHGAALGSGAGLLQLALVALGVSTIVVVQVFAVG